MGGFAHFGLFLRELDPIDPVMTIVAVSAVVCSSQDLQSLQVVRLRGPMVTTDASP